MNADTGKALQPTSLVAGADFRRAYRRVPGAVAVVLVQTDDGPVRGITCTSATSLSGEPPMTLLSVDTKTLFADEVRLARRYSINYLAADREGWARAFAQGGASLAELAHVIGPGRTAAPVLRSGTTCVLECELAEIFPGGDHWVITGHVAHVRVQADAPALLYEAGRYGSFANRNKAD
jgi:flavin reductase (DIM6/NTAB) family NADH-FMN oxidoreductase RutF